MFCIISQALLFIFMHNSVLSYSVVQKQLLTIKLCLNCSLLKLHQNYFYCFSVSKQHSEMCFACSETCGSKYRCPWVMVKYQIPLWNGEIRGRKKIKWECNHWNSINVCCKIAYYIPLNIGKSVCAVPSHSKFFL